MQLDDHGLNIIFREAHTHSIWLDKPVSDALIHQVYDLMKWAPTSANSNPARIVFVRSAAAKERLLPAMAPGNAEKTRTAPVTDSPPDSGPPRLSPQQGNTARLSTTGASQPLRA